MEWRRIRPTAFIVAAALALVAGSSCASSNTETTAPSVTTHNEAPATSSINTDPALTNKPASSTPAVSQEWLYYEWIIHSIVLSPKQASPGETVSIWTNIYCSGNYESPARAFLIVNQEVIDEKALIIPPDEDFPFVFNFTPQTAGFFDIIVRLFYEQPGERANPFDTDVFHVDAPITLNVEE
ncbi:MAG: hypothetical protein JW954_05620 [Dehalococcoidaceae bacterium]|nr:hypothetical protein [Dehalococcoidaceae bacterium]